MLVTGVVITALISSIVTMDYWLDIVIAHH